MTDSIAYPDGEEDDDIFPYEPEDSSLKSRICMAVSVMTITAGILHGFGAFSFLIGNLAWASAATAGLAFIAGLLFDRTREMAMMLLVVGLVAGATMTGVSLSSVGWTAFLSAGTVAWGDTAIIISPQGGWVLLAGLLMLTFCVSVKMVPETDPRAIVRRSAWQMILGAAFTGFAILMLGALSELASHHSEHKECLASPQGYARCVSGSEAK
jgi:hypothetical protein